LLTPSGYSGSVDQDQREGGVIAIRRILRRIRPIRRIRRDERGATAIEYGLICSLIVVAMIGALQSLGGGVGGKWANLSTTLSTKL
jgi:pilus assembly protein Flp/PilA